MRKVTVTYDSADIIDSADEGSFKLPTKGKYMSDDLRVTLSDDGTPLPVTGGGTGANNAADARANLGLGDYAAIQAKVAGAGKIPRFAYGSYAGSGQAGSSHANSLTFDFFPVCVLIMSLAGGTGLGPCTLLRADTAAIGTLGGLTATAAWASSGVSLNASPDVTVAWTNSGVSWYADSAAAQNNASGHTYYYIAIGEALEVSA